MAKPTLWILPEGKKSAIPCPSKYIKPDSRLADLASRLCEGQKYLEDVEPGDIEFFSYDNRSEPLRGDMLLKDVPTTAVAPLIIRYPVSDSDGKKPFSSTFCLLNG